MIIRTWALGIICVLVTAFFVGLTVNAQRIETLNNAQIHMVNNVHYLNMDLERTFYGLNQTFKGIKNYLSSFVQRNITPNNNDIQPILNELVAENPSLLELQILGPNGMTKYWSGINFQEDRQHTDYFSIHKSRIIPDFYVGRPVVSVADKSTWTFAVSKGVRETDGSLSSVMVAIIDLNYIGKRYEGLPLEHGASMTISSTDDYVYLHLPTYEKYIGRYIRGITPAIGKLNNTSVARMYYPEQDTVKLVANRKVSKYPLVVSIVVSEKALLANWEKSASRFVFLGLSICAVLLFMTHRIALYQKQQRLIQEELRSQATTDALTGLANRRFVLDQAGHEIRKAKRSGSPISFVLMDLDYFKEVNDNYGHDIGDMVLKDTAAILKRLCRGSDIVSRYGGEEFLLLLPNTYLDGALTDAERIRKSLEQTSHWCQNKQFTVTASFGVSEWINVEESYENALRRADDALYKVKNRGRNNIMSLPIAKVTPIRKNHSHLRQ